MLVSLISNVVAPNIEAQRDNSAFSVRYLKFPNMDPYER